MSLKNKYRVRSIPNHFAKEFLIYKHYAKRLPIMQFVFGLIDDNNDLIGVCVFSPSPSRFWNNGGKLFNGKHQIDVFELSRLVLLEHDCKNLTSFFVGSCLKLIPKPNVIVSYADINQNHCGYIYQATNFIYVGEAEPKNKSFDFYIGDKKYHGRNMNIEFTRKLLGFKYDETISWKQNFINNGGKIVKQLPKHRYIFINSKNKKKLIDDMIYEPMPYPKTKNKNYKTGDINGTRFLF